MFAVASVASVLFLAICSYVAYRYMHGVVTLREVRSHTQAKDAQKDSHPEAQDHAIPEKRIEMVPPPYRAAAAPSDRDKRYSNSEHLSESSMSSAPAKDRVAPIPSDASTSHVLNNKRAYLHSESDQGSSRRKFESIDDRRPDGVREGKRNHADGMGASGARLVCCKFFFLGFGSLPQTDLVPVIFP